MAEIEILQPGLFSSVQDLGRFGFREFGVPVSGAMDKTAAALANLLLGNSPGAAVLEITFQGPQIKFHAATEIAVTGAELTAELDASKLENNKACSVEAGQVLTFGRRQSGYRAYMAITEGFQTEMFLCSRSWCSGVSPHSRLEKGMRLSFLGGKLERPPLFAAIKPHDYIASAIIEAFPGPEYGLLSASEKENLQKCHFSVARESNRMGIQFQERLGNSLKPILTGPVLPGTVQITPSGTLIALMRDGQTTGGYPRILQVTERGMDILAQKLPGEKFQLKLLSYT